MTVTASILLISICFVLSFRFYGGYRGHCFSAENDLFHPRQLEGFFRASLNKFNARYLSSELQRGQMPVANRAHLLLTIRPIQ